MPELKKYDPKQVIVTWDGINLSNGIADGTFIEIARSVRPFAISVGADGGATKVTNNNRSATVAVTLRFGSDTNTLLSERIIDEELDPPVTHVGPLEICDFNGNTLHEAEAAFLDGPPDESLGVDEPTRTWTLIAASLRMTAGGSLNA